MKTIRTSVFQRNSMILLMGILGITAASFSKETVPNLPPAAVDIPYLFDEGGTGDGGILTAGGGAVLAHTYSVNNVSGPEHRKISVTGCPMPDVKPQQEEESDYTPEETYVDALSLSLRHDVTDIFVPLASDQLTLAIRRNLIPATFQLNYEVSDGVFGVGGLSRGWEDSRGLGLLDASRAFGPCWSSGLDCGLQIVTACHFSYGYAIKSIDAGYRTIATVTDENGQDYRFAIISDETFLPLPSSSVNMDVADLSLIHTNDTYVFKRRYGNTIVFNDQYAVAEGSPPILLLEDTNGIPYIAISNILFAQYTNSATISYYWTGEEFSVRADCCYEENYERRERHRPRYVEDRCGNKLVYSFSGDRLVPDRITALDSTQALTNSSDLSIGITLGTNGCVESVTDPAGNTVSYDYTSSSVNSRATNGLPLLEAVVRDSAVTTYGIEETVIESSLSTDYHHLVLGFVADANSNRYDFTWTENQITPTLGLWGATNAVLDFEEVVTNTGWRTSFEYDPSASYSLQIASVTHGTNTACFGIGQTVSLPMPRILGATNYQQTVVTDMCGNAWTYVFTNAVITNSLDHPFLGTIENEGVSVNQNDALIFQTIQICDSNGGSETYHFDVDAGMALQEAVDYFGNSTFFDHEDEADYSSLGTNENAVLMTTYMAPYLSRPTLQSDPLFNERNYTYETNFNQKASVVDELGRLTYTQFDSVGNRTNMIKYDADADVISITEMAYTNAAYPSFMTCKTVKTFGTGDPAWVTNLVTAFEPHVYGQVGRKIVDPDGLHLETVYDYDKNNNLISVIDPNGNMITNRYDTQNRLVEIGFYEGTHTLKSTKQFWYDPRGNKTWEKDENDHYSHFEYDSRNNRVKTVRIMEVCSAPTNGLACYTPTTNDIVATSEYNALGSLVATVDPRGLRTEYQYDYLRRLTNMIAGADLPVAQQQVTAYEYGTNSGGSIFNSDGWKPTRVIDPRGAVTETDYDALYRPVEVRSEISNGVYAVTRNAYDAVGNLIAVSNKVSDGIWQTTLTTYDGLDRPIYIEYPDLTWLETDYTSTGLKWQTIDVLSRTNQTEYDAAGRPVKTISPEISAGLHAVTETGYDANGNIAWIQDANSNITTNLYDYRNRLVQTVSPLIPVYDAMLHAPTSMHAVVSTAYDAVSNVVSVTDARGNITTNFYDADNRLIVTIAPEVDVYVPGSTPDTRHPITTNVYDKGGNIIATIDANGKTVQMQYDAFGRLTNTIDAVGNTIGFEYDKNGNQTALTDGNGSRTEFTYDGLNRKTGTIYPDANHEDAEYDLVGNRTQRTDCNGQVTEYEYDFRNRLDFVDYNNGHTRDYTYDTVGNLLSVNETPSTNNQQLATNVADVAYSYDALNRVVSETSAGVTHQYQYDLQGNRTNALYGVTGRDVSWTYDALNRISTITTPSTNYASLVTHYAYDLNSNPVYRQYPSGVEETRTFDAMNRLLTLSTVLTNSTFSMSYSYDAVGSAREMTQTSWNLVDKAQDALTHWSYDDRYRLTNETVTVSTNLTVLTNSTSYAWDNADNRLSKTVSSNGVTVCSIIYSNNALNQLLGYTETNSVSSVYSVVNFSYDANGARTNKTVTTTENTEYTEYVYDEDNRLLSASVDSVVSSFAYDYRSRRYYRATPSGTNLCIFDGGLSIQEYDATSYIQPSTNTLRTEFIRGEGMGGGVGGMVYSISTNGIVCSHANHRGDVIARSDSSGDLSWFARYEAYGTRPYEWGDNEDRQMANTKEEEKSLGLLNEGMRYRDLNTGVFLTRDPTGYKDGPNIYCYVHCNPINKFDVLGLSGTLTIHSDRGDGGLLSGHSWITYTSDNGSSHTFSTWRGNADMVDRPGESSRSGVSTSRHIDDATEKNLFSAIDKVRSKGLDSWSYSSPCSDFASDMWNRTGKNIRDRNGAGISNPNTLADSIEKVNRTNKSTERNSLSQSSSEGKNTPKETAPEKTAPEKTSSQDTSSHHGIQPQDTSPQDTSEQDTSEQDTAEQDTSPQHTSEQDTSEQDTSSQDTSIQQ